MKSPAMLLGCFLVAALLSGAASAVEIDKDYHESFDVSEGFTLVLGNGDGDVTITPWDQDVIDVTVRYRADVKRVGLGDPPDFEVEFERGDDFVRVTGRTTPSGPAVIQVKRVHEYWYTIKAPPYVQLDINGDDGDVDVQGWRAPIDCSVDDGDVLLDVAEGSVLNVDSDDGDVTVQGASGEARIASDDGDVFLSRCRAVNAAIALDDGDLLATDCSGHLSVATDDGDVSLDLESVDGARVSSDDGDVDIAVASGEVGDIDVSADDGNVKVSTPPGGSYSFLITVGDGQVRLDLKESDKYRKDEHSASGTVRGGGGRITIETDDGDVILLEG